jgi:hypothetical protein
VINAGGVKQPAAPPKLLPNSISETWLAPPKGPIAAPQESPTFVAPISRPAGTTADRPARSTSAFNDVPAGGDTFDMPLNQLPKN